MKQKLSTLVLFLTLVLGVAFSWASPPESSTPAPSKAGETQVHLTRKEMMDKLQVTKEQKVLLRQNRAHYRKKIAVIDGQLKVKKVDLENEVEKPEPDKEKIDQLTAEIGVLLGKKYDAQIEAELEIEKKILTPQQVELLKSLQGREVFVPNDIF